MAKRSLKYLQDLKAFCDRTYGGMYGNRLYINEDEEFSPGSKNLGFCYKFIEPDSKRSVYQIVLARTGKEYTDFRIKMHEYGHIYLGHLDGIHETLDQKLCTLFRDHRQELIDDLNKKLGINDADKLIDRVIDDPVLNHSLHNIAMDMEVNSTVLSPEDIEEMEKDITSLYPKFSTLLDKYLEENPDLPEEVKKKLSDDIKKLDDEMRVKLILPRDYKISEDIPFPDDLTYPDYLILIVEHLDQFVKMLASLKAGLGIKDISARDLQNFLNNPNRDWGNMSEEYKQGYQDALNDVRNGEPNKKENRPVEDEQSQQEYDKGYQDALDDLQNGTSKNLVDALDDFLTQGSSSSSIGPWREKESHYTERKEIRKPLDHNNESRESADKKRHDGTLKAGGGIGCGNRGTSVGLRDIDYQVDAIDMALDEVVRNFRTRVIKLGVKKDLMRNYNRGIVRSVISPTISRKITISHEQKIVYLIDISGSMDTVLVDRIMVAIRNNMRRINQGLKYDIITWNTGLGQHIKDIDPRKPVPEIDYGGGTRIADGIRYFKENYGPEATLIIISDFEDNLMEWNEEEKTMKDYLIFGFNYGTNRWTNSEEIPWKNLKLRSFNEN